jgi:hypothetical protein
VAQDEGVSGVAQKSAELSAIDERGVKRRWPASGRWDGEACLFARGGGVLRDVGYFGSLLFGLVLVVAACAAPTAHAESWGEGKEAAQYYVQLDDEDQLKISVHVWGKVSTPGLYVVPRTTDLVTLISYAGGPGSDADLSGVRIVRSNGAVPRVMKVDLSKYMRSGDESQNPLLEPGDTVQIGPNRIHGLSRFVQFVAQTAVIVSTYYLIFER